MVSAMQRASVCGLVLLRLDARVCVQFVCIFSVYGQTNDTKLGTSSFIRLSCYGYSEFMCLWMAV